MIYAVMGYEPLAQEQLLRYARDSGVPLTDELREWSQIYADLCPVAGIRTSVAWAQSCHETGFFRYAGDAKPEWNNPCGLGVGSQPLVRNGVEVPNSSNCKFATKIDGARAHLGHLAVYFSPYDLAYFCEKDPRHVPHRHLENDVRELGGTGRWAPNVMYGAALGEEAFHLLTAV